MLMGLFNIGKLQFTPRIKDILITYMGSCDTNCEIPVKYETTQHCYYVVFWCFLYSLQTLFTVKFHIHSAQSHYYPMLCCQYDGVL